MSRLVVPVLTPSAADVVAHLAADGRVEVIAVVVDVGQSHGLDGVRDAALRGGARRCHVVDRREALSTSVLWPALRAGALAVPGPPVVGALSMPVVAEAAAAIVQHESAEALAVWADDPLDRRRLRALFRAAAPATGLVSLPQGPAGEARNLWAAVRPAGADVPAGRPVDHGRASLRVSFERGSPVALNGVALSPAELIDSLATIAADHGLGPQRVTDAGQAWDVDAPAAQLLHHAREIMVARVADAPSGALFETLAAAYAALVRDGAWFSPARAGIDAGVDRLLASADGEVTLQIAHGRIEGDA